MSDARRVERITKLDAIRRQLRTAIRLFFEERDSVSIYTLAAAAEGLLRDLLKPQGEGSFLRDPDRIIPEKWIEFLRIMNRPQNFFKHADSDPDEVLEFAPQATEGILFDYVQMYQKFTGRQLREGIAFVGWYVTTYPHVLKPGPFADSIAKATSKAGESVPSKGAYLQLLARGDPWQDAD